MRNPLSDTIVTIKPSGIRKFFDIVSEMEDAISLGVGEPDFDTPWHIRDEGIYSLEKGRTFYTSNAGLKQLREEIAHYLRRRYQVSYDPLHEIMITVGGSEAIDIALRAMVNPGDEVLIPQPSYVSYEPCAVLAGAKPVIIPLKAENEFRLTAQELLDAITEKTKILILPYPNNPTGAIMEREDLEAIAKIVEEKDLFVISDEIYSELTYKRQSGFHHTDSGDAGADGPDQRIFQGICNDRLASGLCLRTGSDFKTDAQNPSVCDHVCSYDEPVCGGRGAEKRR